MRYDPTYDEYQGWIKEAFGENDATVPSMTFIQKYGDRITSFASAYIHNLTTMYIQTIGFINGAKPSYREYVKMVEEVEAEGYLFTMGTILNTNVTAIVWALRSGFVISGVRVSSDGKLYVEILRANKTPKRFD